jgi:ABC-type sugar transport system substrate-binding protein
MGFQSVPSSRYSKLGLKLGMIVAAATLGVGLAGASAAQAATVYPAAVHPATGASFVQPAADYWELWDTDIPNPQACINEGKALVLNGTADDYKCTGGGVDYSLYIIPRNG